MSSHVTTKEKAWTTTSWAISQSLCNVVSLGERNNRTISERFKEKRNCTFIEKNENL